MRCIYCLQERPLDQFSRAEHVIPKSFGGFKNNLVLNSDSSRIVVCDDCNQFFGDHVEIALARDSLEGLYRLEYYVQKPKDFKGVGKRGRIAIRVEEDGIFKGAHAYVEHSPELGRNVVSPLPQIGFLRSTGDQYEWFLLDKIPDQAFLHAQGYRLSDPKAFIIVGCSEEVANAKLKEKGCRPQSLSAISVTPSPSKSVKCAVTGEWDITVTRAIAKIAFNYLAYWEGAEFVFGKSFDLIRQYIRYGNPVEPDPVSVSKHPMLPDEQPGDYRRMAHLIAVGTTEGGASVIANVSLLNWMTHVVVLARDHGTQPKAAGRCHYFSIKTLEITELSPVPALQTRGDWQ